MSDELSNDAQFVRDAESVRDDGYRTDDERRLARWALGLHAKLERQAATYTQPNEGWACFHCGERFLKYGPAKAHFGETPDALAACARLVDAMHTVSDKLEEAK
jgi:hypothetical protein